MRLSHTLSVTFEASGAFVSCAACGHQLCGTGEPWKPAAALRERPLRSLGGIYISADQVVLREFSCPHCHVLLDTETALLGDSFLNDVVTGETRRNT